MADKLQSLDAIQPMARDVGGSDPIKAEYDEGRKYFGNKEYGQAAVCFHNALVGYEERGDETGIANACNQIGHVCLARKDFDTALTHYERVYEICNKLNDPMSKLAVRSQEIIAYRAQKKFGKAIELVFEIIDIYRDNRDPKGTVAILDTLADIYLEAGESAKAADTYRTIASIHKNFRHDGIAENYRQKADKLANAN